MTQVSTACRICDDDSVKTLFIVREMMFGLKDEFKYYECPTCGCLQLLNPPEDMSRYYPGNYVSFRPTGQRTLTVKGFLRYHRDQSYFRSWDVLGRFLSRMYKRGDLDSVAKLMPKVNSKILDVGCGSGHLLVDLQRAGFKNLAGVDPFIGHEIDYGTGLRIKKCFLSELNDKNWDVIMFHHSLEHIPDPVDTLRTVSSLLAENGICIIRVPVANSWAWEHYGVNWVQLDAPRHLLIHSETSLSIAARKADLQVKRVEYDSTGFQFWGSELYQRGIALKSYESSPRKDTVFTNAELRRFAREAKRLNRQRQGDQAVFYLCKA